MLKGSTIQAAAAVLAIFFSAAMNNRAQATFVTGDFITLRQVEWGDAPVLETPHPFATIYPSGLVVGLISADLTLHSIVFTSGPAVVVYLPTAVAPAALTGNHIDTTFPHGGQFGGEIAALHLNIDFNDAGLIGGTLGIPFGDLTLTNLSGLPDLEGVRVREFASIANRAIAGDATGFSLDDLTMISALLNSSFLSGPDLFGPSAWAQDHLTIVPEPSTSGLALLALVALASRRNRKAAGSVRSFNLELERNRC